MSRKVRAAMMVAGKATSLDLCDDSGKVRSDMSVDKNVSHLSLYDDIGSQRVTLGSP